MALKRHCSTVRRAPSSLRTLHRAVFRPQFALRTLHRAIQKNRSLRFGGRGKFESDESGKAFAGVGEGLIEIVGEPFRVAALHGERGGRFAVGTAAEGTVGQGDKNERSGKVAGWNNTAGLQLVEGGATPYLNSENLLRASLKDFETAGVLFLGAGSLRSWSSWRNSTAMLRNVASARLRAA